MIEGEFTYIDMPINYSINYLFDNTTGQGGFVNYYMQNYEIGGEQLYLIFYSGVVN